MGIAISGLVQQFHVCAGTADVNKNDQLDGSLPSAKELKGTEEVASFMQCEENMARENALRAMLNTTQNKPTIVDALAQSSEFECGKALTDPRDGQQYPTGQFGDKCFTLKNMAYSPLDTTSFPFSNTKDSWTRNAWRRTVGNEESAVVAGKSYLYSWSAAMQGSTKEGAQGICPPQWHIPTNEDFEGATNSAAGSFADVMAGGRDADGTSAIQVSNTFFWSSTSPGGNAWGRSLLSERAEVHKYTYSKGDGLPVRCEMD